MCLVSRSKTAPSTPTLPLAAMAAYQIAKVRPVLVELEAAEAAYPAMAEQAAISQEAAGAAAPEETEGVELVGVEAAEVEPYLMVQAERTAPPVPADTSAAVQAENSKVLAVMPPAPAAAAVAAGRRVIASSLRKLDPMEPMVPTEEEGAAEAATTITRRGAGVAVMADLAVAVVVQGRSGLSSVVRTEEMVDLAEERASAWAPTLIRTALPETGAVSEEVATAVVAVGVELWEAPSSIKAVKL